MKRIRVIWFLVAAVCIIVALLGLRRNLKETKVIEGRVERVSDGGRTGNFNVRTNNVAIARSKSVRNVEEKLDDQWRTPITFYGKVIDQNGLGVGGANIDLVWNTVAGSSRRTLTSSTDGTFTFVGENGYVLSVTVKKQGYHSSKRDDRIFYYGEPAGNHIPNADDPVVFHLHRAEGAEQLIHVKRSFAMKRDGSPLHLSLREGIEDPSGVEILQVECWTFDSAPDSERRYDWSCHLSVPNGGLLASTNEFDFVAPDLGYKSEYTITMSKDVPESWARSAQVHLFVKTGGGNFGRVSFQMVAGGDHFCLIESFLNPTGSRNVEYNGSNAIRRPTIR